jgi:hypothetical protein
MIPDASPPVRQRAAERAFDTKSPLELSENFGRAVIRVLGPLGFEIASLACESLPRRYEDQLRQRRRRVFLIAQKQDAPLRVPSSTQIVIRR